MSTSHHQQNVVSPTVNNNHGGGANVANGNNGIHLTPNSLPSAAVPDPLLRCQWLPCTEHPTSAANLYDHLCEAHIGRKSTNNLNLVCGWDGCRISTVKRDHITSHVRVHVPLKPHSCPFCSKCFKRPQDLKKHVKTHADDSVLAAPPQQAPRPAPLHGGQNPGYGQVPSNHGTGAVANLQNLAASNGGYYGQGGQMNHGSGGGYPPPHHAPSGYYHPQQPSSYGPVYYPVNHGGDLGHSGGYDFRKRYDALNDFFGDAKRRQIDPTSYAEVGNRLNVLEGLSTPGSSMADFLSTGPALASLGSHGGGGPMVQQHHSLPSMPSLRTKNDLLSMDQFLNQVQATVYETTSPAARAGVQQPGAHYAPQTYRPSRSPPQDIHGLSSLAQGAAAQGTAPMRATHSSQSNSSGTPALTPASSSVSYSSGHSPTSSQGLSPLAGHSSTSAPYPNLPANSAGYSPHATTAPTSTLGTNFESDFRRRYSGGMLQRGAEYQPEASSRSEFHLDPALSGATYPHRQVESRDDQIDPALSDSQDEDDDHPEWVGHIRMVEKLREMVTKRLQQHQYEDAEDEVMVKEEPAGVGMSLYPVLPEDED